jgi:hypothetical protein
MTMDSPGRVSLKSLVLGTKLGRMTLFAGFLAVLALAVPGDRACKGEYSVKSWG